MKKIAQFVSTILVIAISQGCAVTQEGVSIGETHKFGAEALLDTKGEEANQLAEEGGLILIGTASAFRRFQDSNIEKTYSHYTEFSYNLHPESPPSITLATFKRSFSGWTKLKYLTVPLVFGLYEDALVPTGMSDEIYFPSSETPFLVQEAVDLLAARTNADGFYIVSEILCKNGSGYYDCAEKYEKGIFHGSSGVELDDDLTHKSGGKRIDINSLKVIVDEAM